MHLTSRADGPQARIPLHNAGALSHAATSFGARNEREARRRPGGFQRPIVGSDPAYYGRAAQMVFDEAVRSDPRLSKLYLTAASLSNTLLSQVTTPYAISGPDTTAADNLATITHRIHAAVMEKDLTITLAGKHLNRAVAISDFALRVIVGTHGQGLYPGLGPEAPVNSAGYWAQLQQRLTTQPRSIA